ncbi:MAG: MBOAT family O-acyltransferase, partial [Bacteroidota bacterium]
FFLDSLVSLLQMLGLSWQTDSLDIILPVGISFYTFQTLSYSLDIYYRRLEPTRDILAFFTFVAFFPQLVAGPVERASHLLPQFLRKELPIPEIGKGLAQMLQGFFKKLVIADALAPWVNSAYADPGQWSAWVMLLATIGFALQIYADFSGYSDIAIGCARLFGIELRTNFRRPYLAASLQEFWTRWHISLSTWFRDYVYIPLGGNRGRTAFWMRNIAITFLVSGLWHGANWTFVVWGALHGAGYLIESRFNLPNPLGWIWTLGVVLLGWVFFRAESINQAFEVLSVFRSQPELGGITVWYSKAEWLVPLWIMLISLAGWLAIEGMREMRKAEPDFDWALWQYYGLLIWILVAGAFGQPQAFIYFQF